MKKKKYNFILFFVIEIAYTQALIG